MSQYFSRMLTKDGIKPTVPAGTWQQDTYLPLLSTFAANLDISANTTDASSLNSVPVPWARLILFENALFDPRHPAHQEVKNQWRGLLGLIALAAPLGLKLGLKTIDLSKYENSGIAKAFLDLSPNEAEKQVGKWRWFQLLTLGNSVIGATSPRTLIFTGVANDCPSSIPFSQNGRLSDPARYYRYFNDQFYLKLLNTWLSDFIEKLQGNGIIEDLLGNFPTAKGGMTVSRHSRLLNILQEWQTEIGYTGENFPIGNPFNPIFTLPGYNDIVGLPDIPQEPESDLMLRNNRRVIIGYTGKNNGIYNANRQFLSGESLRVYNGRWVQANESLPTSFDFFPENFKYLENPAQLFEETLLLVDLPNNPEGVYFLHPHNEKEKYLFPFKSEILEYFLPEEISDNTLITRDQNNNSLIVEFRFPLANNRFIVVRREYPSEKVLSPLSEAIAKWPDFVSPDWNYYVYYIKKMPQELSFKPLGKTVKRIWNDQSDYECHLSTEPLQAFTGNYADAEGLLLLRSNKIREPQHYWKVGVDFGSTHTRSFYREVQQEGDGFTAGSDTIKPLVFKPRAKELTDCANSEIRANFPELSQEFDPNWHMEQEELNTRLKLPVQSNMEFENWLPQEGFIFKYPIREAGSGVLRENLKWNNNTDNYDMRSFLRSLLLMIEAEACAAGARVVSYRHTYPSVFTPGLIRKHDNEWSGLEGFINKWRRSDDLQVSIPPAEIMETVAVCRHLTAEQSAVPSSNTISLDVGGSTTDIAVWADNELKLQESVKLSAGVIGNYLKSPNAEPFLDWLLEVVNGKPFNRQIDATEFKKIPASNFNDLLSTLTWSNQLDRLILNITAQPDETRNFLSHIIYVFSSLLYYSGMLARKQDLHRQNDEFYIYFCGRGSKLIEWITEATNPGLYKKLVNDIFSAGLRGPQNLHSQKPLHIKIMLSQYTKEEVGRGLLAESSLAGNRKESFMTIRPNTVTVGETSYADLDWDGELTATALKNLDKSKIPDISKLTELMYFIEVFKKSEVTRQASKVLGIDNLRPTEYRNKLLERLFGQAKGSIIYDLTQNEDDALLEPIFITEIKVLLETLTNNSKLFTTDK